MPRSPISPQETWVFYIWWLTLKTYIDKHWLTLTNIEDKHVSLWLAFEFYKTIIMIKNGEDAAVRCVKPWRTLQNLEEDFVEIWSHVQKFVHAFVVIHLVTFELFCIFILISQVFMILLKWIILLKYITWFQRYQGY